MSVLALSGNGSLLTPRGSTAVCARRSEPADSLDFFPTPPWATRALFEHVLPQIIPGRTVSSAWDPACGEGHMAAVLGEYAGATYASDIFPYGFGSVADFLTADMRPIAGASWIITNPPFNLALDFALAALELAQVGVALLCRTSWSEGEERYARLFNRHRPFVAQFVERVPMVKGRYAVNAKSATAYTWFVFLNDRSVRPEPLWIPPCRKSLSRISDVLDFRGCSDLPLSHPVRLELERRAA